HCQSSSDVSATVLQDPTHWSARELAQFRPLHLWVEDGCDHASTQIADDDKVVARAVDACTASLDSDAFRLPEDADLHHWPLDDLTQRVPPQLKTDVVDRD